MVMYEFVWDFIDEHSYEGGELSVKYTALQYCISTSTVLDNLMTTNDHCITLLPCDRGISTLVRTRSAQIAVD